MAKRSAKAAPESPQKGLFKKRRYAPGSRKGAGNPHPHPPPVEHQIKPGEVRNPGGRPKLLSDAYRAWLEKEIRLDSGELSTNAELVARGQGVSAVGGNTGAAREIRQATEGDTLHLNADDLERLSDADLNRLIDSLTRRA